MRPGRADARPERILVLAFAFALFDHEDFVGRFFIVTHDSTPWGTVRKRKGKPGRDPHRRLPDVDLLDLCDELENGAAFSAIAEAAPGVVADVDDELLVVAAVMDRAGGAHRVAGAFELAQPSVMIQDHDDGDASLEKLVVDEDVVVLAHVKDQS